MAGSSFRSILVGTDGSATAQAAVDAAVELAAELNAQLVIVSAFQPTDLGRAGTPGRHEADVQWEVNARETVVALLDQTIAAAAAAGVGDVVTYARQGDPADAIIDVAEEQGCDLIIIGNKGMTGARRFLLGSVPNKVSHHAPCSVMIVRTS